MIGITHTAESLAAMESRELDRHVHRTLFPVEYQGAYGGYSTSYEYMKLVIDRMLEQGYYFDIGGNKSRIIAEFSVEKDDGLATASEAHDRSLPRAVAIAAILAIQSRNEQNP